MIVCELLLHKKKNDRKVGSYYSRRHANQNSWKPREREDAKKKKNVVLILVRVNWIRSGQVRSGQGTGCGSSSSTCKRNTIYGNFLVGPFK